MFLTVKGIMSFPVLENLITSYSRPLYMNDPQKGSSTQDSIALVRGNSGAVVPHDYNTAGPSSSIVQPGSYISRKEAELETKWLKEDIPPLSKSQDIPLDKYELKSCCLGRMSTTQMENTYPSHMRGKHDGYGVMGGNHAPTLLNLLKVTTEDHENILYEFKIPPRKYEPMVHSSSQFWWLLNEKYHFPNSKDTIVSHPSVKWKWPARHTDAISTSLDDASNYRHDTMINIMFKKDASVQEKRATCEYIMRAMKRALEDPNNRPSLNEASRQQYFKNLHEFLAARHYYQLWLFEELQNNSLQESTKSDKIAELGIIGKPSRVSDDHKYKNEFDETNAEIVRINNKVLEVNEEMLNNHAKDKKK